MSMDILYWLLIGLVAGGVASFIVPGRTPAGVIGAIVIGILGGLLGGWLLDSVFEMDTGGGLIGALVVAIVGAVIILFALRQVEQRT